VSGNESGDNCAFAGGFDPEAGSSPTAFLPVLGGDANSGTLFDQVVGANPYYTQSEWSNGDDACEMQPTSSVLNAAFSVPSTVTTGMPAFFDPSGSSSAGGYASTSWSFGDGATSFSRSAPAPISETYSTPGTYLVSLTVIDSHGAVSTVSHAVTVTDTAGATATTPQSVTDLGAPVAAITVRHANPVAGVPFSLSGSRSTDFGSVITAYRWRLDRRSTAQGVSVSHTYRRLGRYRVSLTVTDRSGATSSAVRTLVVRSASITSVTGHRAGKVELLRLRISGPGMLKIGSKKVKVHQARVVVFRLALSSAQVASARSRHPVTVILRARFTPRVGKPSKRTIRIKIGR
jgi:hypothetical protein